MPAAIHRRHRRSKSRFGPELTTAATTVNAPWVNNGDGTYSIDGSQATTTSLFYSGLLEAGRTYRAVIEVSAVTSSGIIRLTSGPGSASLGSVGTPGTYTVDLAAGAVNMNFGANPGFAGTVRLKSIREVLP
jgi:hypothetical protein